MNFQTKTITQKRLKKNQHSSFSESNLQFDAGVNCRLNEILNKVSKSFLCDMRFYCDNIFLFCTKRMPGA